MPPLEQLFGVFPPMNLGGEDTHLASFSSPDAPDSLGTETADVSNVESNAMLRLGSELADTAHNDIRPSFSTVISSPGANSSFSSKYLGPTSETDPLLRSKYRYDDRGIFVHKIRAIRRLSTMDSPTSLALLTPQAVTEGLADRVIAHSVPPIWHTLSEHGESLINLFLRFIQPQYPVLSSYGLRPDDDSRALLATVYSLALPWRSYDPDLPWEQFNLDAVTRRERPDDSIIQQFAWREISRGMHAPDYSTIAACLLFMERKRDNMFIADSPFDTCLVATTTSMAFSLGLHMNCSDWNMSTDEKIRRDTLWWLVYVQDKWINIIHGQPPRIREDDFEVPWWDSAQSHLSMGTQARTSVLFRHLLELTSILDNVYTCLFSLRNLSKTLSPESFEHLTTRLADWKTSHDHLSELETVEGHDDFYGLGSQLVAHHYCYVLIHRKALSVSDEQADFSTAHERALTFGERMLADLKQLNLASFDSFWFSWSRAHFNAISDLVVLLHIRAPTDLARGRAAHLAARYRDWLCMRSKSFEIVRMGLTRLDSLNKPELWED
ncbi:hypothetical protein G7046_g7759 [Stylonectria norvegica]|nr:hypothetical protein G7046_g7759 [Stylonectria norvegica]